MIWRTDRPTEKVIVAKLSEDFCHAKDRYAVLYLTDKPYQHYCEYGEEIPYSAIEKWALLEEKSSEDLEKEIDRVFLQKDCGSDRLHHKEIAEIAHHFVQWQRERMLKEAVEAEVYGCGDEMTPEIAVELGSDYKPGGQG